MILETVRNRTKDFWPIWRSRQKFFTSLHNQNKDNNQFKSKEPKMPEKHLYASPTTKELKKHISRRCPKTQKYGPNERLDQNSRKRTKQRGDSQPI